MAKTSDQTIHILLKLILIGVVLIIGILIYMILINSKSNTPENVTDDNVNIEEPAEADSEAFPTTVNPQVTD